jgi:signal transduction histidine kinase
MAAVARLNPGSVLAERPIEYVAALMTYALMPVCAWVLGNSMAHRRAYLAALEERAVRAEAERDAHAQVAAAAERARIARELHDVIAHNLSVMVAQADGAGTPSTPSRNDPGRLWRRSATPAVRRSRR